jgi:hypothetical protein
MTPAELECIKAAILEALGLGGVTAIVAYLRGAASVAEAVASSAFRRLIKRLVRGFLKKGLTRIIPWIGAAALIASIIYNLLNCF